MDIRSLSLSKTSSVNEAYYIGVNGMPGSPQFVTVAPGSVHVSVRAQMP